ncbi:MAG: alpha-L-rhamnosidase, partial [Prevotellaceae bacterium]|nr:alpha-L-rhamnosidase [Prevotellaceae bacterium]
MKNNILIILFTGWCMNIAAQTLPPVFGEEYAGKVFHDSRTRSYIAPQRIVWKQDGDGQLITNSESLLTQSNNGQSELTDRKACTMRNTGNGTPAILFDFGKEIQGGIQLVTTVETGRNAKIRVRFGESASEAMSEIGGAQGATNDHAMRDFTMELPWLGVAEVGNSGFRFVRIDLIEPNTHLSLKEINAVFAYRDIPYLGSFRSNDERLNNIWMTGAYTVHLNMQEYIWDGIKRDRLVWLGDLHPEVMTVSTVFGYNEVIPKSLDLARDITPLPGWMNGMCSYSLWWVIIHRDWYNYQGNLQYLKEQQPYLTELLRLLLSKVDSDGKERLDGGGRFLDWPSSPNVKGIDAGLQALMIITMQAGSEICAALGDRALSEQCAETAKRMRKYVPDHNHLKQAAALMALADIYPARKANEEVLTVGGARGFSTFYGYYMLEAQAKAGEYQTAVNNIRQYWGGMLDMGATTFWEDF